MIDTAFKEGETKQKALQSLKNLLKTLSKFPNWSETEISDFTEIKISTVGEFTSLLKSKDQTAVQSFISLNLLPNLIITDTEQLEIDYLVQQAMTQFRK